MLYFRMILMMCVTLYTSRVVLAALGVEDYGIYNVVGGFVAMFAMISNFLSTTISRFITFELGKGNQERLNTIFSTAMIIQLVIGVFIVILIETVGVWFLENKMVIPADRLFAARWVLHFSLITLIINLISIPFRATIIAHERMNAFAYISILEAMCKLGVAYFIAIAPIDRLVFYAVLMASVALIIRFTYSIYCRRHFVEARFRWVLDKVLFKEMFGFAGWMFFGRSARILRDQGGNILLNMFCGGPVINAAMGIANQVKSAVVQFSSNFMMALNPQIIKSYAAGNRDYMFSLIFQGSRLSFYLLLTLALPIIINVSYILQLWLGKVPDYTVVFVRLSLLLGMCEALSNPLITAQNATGNIKMYQMLVGGVVMLNLPISYILLRYGAPPTTVLFVAISLSVTCLFARVCYLRGSIRLPVRKFVKNVLFNVVLVSAISAIVPHYVKRIITNDGLFEFMAVTAVCILSTLSTIYVIGCNGEERQFVKRSIVKFTDRLKNNRAKN